jgi:class 3 adenylate cyclase
LGLGLSVRAGVHVGEIELRGGDVAGIGVVIARRVCDLADPGQILVSHAVPPLVAGADFSFASRGARQLKGVPGEWTLHEVL